jgi:uncharacterized protein (DUF58 family)
VSRAGDPSTPVAGAAADPDELQALLAEVRRIDVQSRRLVTGVMAGGYASVFRGEGLEVKDVREYVEGDDPRSVDWNVTARVGRPFVKTYVPERERILLPLLDLSASTTGGWGAWSVRQVAARVVAALALSATRHGDKVGLLAFADDVVAHVAPRKGLGHALRIVRDCLALPARAVPTDPIPALERAARTVRRRAIVFLVSDFLFGDGWQRALVRCARRHDVIAVRLLSPELAPPARGLQRLCDPETGATVVVDWSVARARDAYAARVATWRERGAEDLRRAGVDRIDVPIPPVPTRDVFAGPLVRFFRMRELRGTKR